MIWSLKMLLLRPSVNLVVNSLFINLYTFWGQGFQLCVWKSRIRSHAQVCHTPTKYTFLNSLSKILTWLLEIWNFVIFTRKRMQNDVHVKSNDPRALKVCPTPTKYTFLNSLSIILTWLLEIWNFVIFTCKERKNDVHVKNNDQILFLLCSTPIN